MDIFALFAHYGLLALFVCVLVEQMGMPIPALPVIVVAGVASASNPIFALQALLVACVASTISDSIWFYSGKYFGRKVLGLLCRISISPDTCVRQSELNFARRGAATLVMAKFIPGVSMLASPLAGALGMKYGKFVLYNLTGILLWAGSGILFGLLFHEQAHQILDYLSNLGSTATYVLLSCVGLYIAYRMWRRWATRRALAHIPRLAPNELFELITQGADLLILDVRAKVIATAESEHIPGARRIELTEIETISIETITSASKIITYCACPNDASALKAAQLLIKRGHPISVLKGGIDGWIKAGYTVALP